MRYRFSFAFVMAARLVALPAAGQGTGTDPAAAAALFQEGREAAKRGDYLTACPKLGDSYRLDPAVGTLLNLADCNEHLGKLATAWQLFRQAAERLTPDDDRMAAAQRRIAALAPRVPHLTIGVSKSAPAGTKVTRGGVDLGSGSLGAVLPIDPGRHVVVVTAPERSERRFDVEMAEGQSHHLMVEPGGLLPQPTSAALQGTPPVATASSSGKTGGIGTVRVIGIVVGSVGVAGLAVAIGTGLILPSKESAVLARCDADKRCDQEGYAAAQEGQTLAALNTTMWFAGGIVTGVGVALILAGGEDTKPSTAIQLNPLPGGAGASVLGRF